MIYDDPEDDLGDELSPEELAVTRRDPFKYDDGHNMDLLECEWMAELRQIDEDNAEQEAEERQRRSEAAKRAWAKRKAAQKPRRIKKRLRSIDDPWLG